MRIGSGDIPRFNPETDLPEVLAAEGYGVVAAADPPYELGSHTQSLTPTLYGDPQKRTFRVNAACAGGYHLDLDRTAVVGRIAQQFAYGSDFAPGNAGVYFDTTTGDVKALASSEVKRHLLDVGVDNTFIGFLGVVSLAAARAHGATAVELGRHFKNRPPLYLGRGFMYPERIVGVTLADLVLLNGVGIDTLQAPSANAVVSRQLARVGIEAV